MTNKEKIEALKNNKEAFCLMDKELQVKAEEIGEQDFCRRWGGVWSVIGNFPRFDKDYTYRLRPDYTEEPEVERCKVEPGKLNTLRFSTTSLVQNFSDIDISFAAGMPKFIGIEADGWLYGRLYRHKETGMMHTVIQVKDVDTYEVLTPTHALFRGAK